MSRKNVIAPYKIADNQSLATSFETPPTNIQFLDNVALQVSTSGVTDNTGQFSIQVSNDGQTWQDIDLDPAIDPLADDNANIFVNMSQLAFAQIRLKFVAAGGTPDGTVTAIITAKEL